MSAFGTPSLGSGGSRSAPTVVTTPVVTNLGDLIIVAAGWSDSGTISSVMDSAGNTYVPGTQFTVDFSTIVQHWYCLAATQASASNVITVTFSNPTNNNTIAFVRSVPMTGAVASLDVEVTYDGSSDHTTAVYSTNGNDEFVAVTAYDQFGGGGYAAQVSPAYTLDSANFGTFGGAEHIIFASPQNSIQSGFAAGSGGSSAFGIAFMAAAPPTFAITGNAGIAFATVNLTGDATDTTQADSSGDYELDEVAGSYVITPLYSSYVFTPPSISLVLSADSPDNNFTATPPASGIYLVQQGNAVFQGTNTGTLAFASDTTAGNDIIISIYGLDQNSAVPVTLTVSDGTNTYATVELAQLNSTNLGASWFAGIVRAMNIAGGAVTVTATVNVQSGDESSTQFGFTIYEVHGLAQVAVDATTTNTVDQGGGGVYPVTAGNVTPTVVGDLVFAAAASQDTTGQVPFTAGAGFALDAAPIVNEFGAFTELGSENQIRSDTSAVNCDFNNTLSGSPVYAAVGVAFKPASNTPGGGGSKGPNIFGTQIFGAEIITPGGITFGTGTRTRITK